MLCRLTLKVICLLNPVLNSKCSTMQTLTDRAASHCVSFVLGLREKHLLPSSVQEQHVSSVQHMLSSALSDYRDVIVHNLQANDVQINDELESCLNVEQPCSSLGKHVESGYSLLRYCVDVMALAWCSSALPWLEASQPRSDVTL